MSPTTIQPVGQLVAGVRTAIDDHADVTRVGSSVRRHHNLPAER
jgi:hypothetical protein